MSTLRHAVRLILNDKECRIIALLFALFFALDSYGAECTSISRTANSANAVLTSTKYNSDHDTAYGIINDIIGSTCTLPLDSITQTDLESWDNGIQQGCKVSYSDASTLSVDRCILTLGGNRVKTTAANTVAFACSGCSSEVASTSYYVYAKADSTGTTLNLLILTDAPNGDGFDSSGNKVLGKFFNDSGSNIDQYSITQCNGTCEDNTMTEWVSFTPSYNSDTTAPGKATSTTVDGGYFRRNGDSMEFVVNYYGGSGGSNGSGSFYYLTIPGSRTIDLTKQLNVDSLNPAGAAGGAARVIGSTGFISNAPSCLLDQASSFQGQPFIRDATSVGMHFTQLTSGSNVFTIWGPGTGSHRFGDSGTCFNITGSVPITGWD